MSVVNKALHELIRSNVPSRKHYTVTRAETTNLDPSRCPWVGIYRDEAEYEPRNIASLKSGKKWASSNNIKVLVQAASGKSGIDAEEKLEDYIADVMDVVLSNPTIGDTVKTIVRVTVSYSYNEEATKTLFFNMAEITITVESRT